MAWISTGAYLGMNDPLVSDNGLYYAIMQGDGNFVLYHGSGPSNQGPAYWASNTAQGQGQYYAIMQSDGNFVIYKGSDPTHQGAFVWNSGPTAGQGQYYAVMQNDGNFVIYKGSDPTHQGAFVWNTGTANGQVTVHNQGGYQAMCFVGYTLNGQPHAQNSSVLDLGQSYSVTIPFGANDVEVRCVDNQWGVGAPDTWKTIFDNRYPTTPQITFTLTGTTLNPGVNQS